MIFLLNDLSGALAPGKYLSVSRAATPAAKWHIYRTAQREEIFTVPRVSVGAHGPSRMRGGERTRVAASVSPEYRRSGHAKSFPPPAPGTLPLVTLCLLGINSVLCPDCIPEWRVHLTKKPCCREYSPIFTGGLPVQFCVRTNAHSVEPAATTPIQSSTAGSSTTVSGTTVCRRRRRLEGRLRSARALRHRRRRRRLLAGRLPSARALEGTLARHPAQCSC